MTLTTGFTLGGWAPAIDPALAAVATCPFAEGSDEFYMFQALLVGQSRGAMANPNPSVGCVVVKNGQILSTGCTQGWGLWHGEREAFEALSAEDLQGATVYVTLEPCHHTGRQPPCTALFAQKPPARVVIACLDPNPLASGQGTCGQGVQALRALGIEVVVGVLEKEAQAWHGPFLATIERPQQPFVALKWAQSIDGALALPPGGPHPITGPLARTYAHWLRQKYDGIVVGASTILHDAPSLNVRLVTSLPTVRHPLKIVVDPRGRLVLSSPDSIQGYGQKRHWWDTGLGTSGAFILVSPSVYDQVQTAPENSPLKDALTQNQVTLLPVDFGNAPAQKILETLVHSPKVRQALGRPLQSILVEGGPRLHSLFMSEFLFDALHVFVGPWLFGKNPYKLFLTPAVQDETQIQTPLPHKLPLVSCLNLGEDILLEYDKPNNSFF